MLDLITVHTSLVPKYRAYRWSPRDVEESLSITPCLLIDKHILKHHIF